MEALARVVAALVTVFLVLCALPAAAQDVRAGVEQLAAQVVKGTHEGKQLRVAVADFPDLQGVTSDLGRFIASRLTTRLAQERKFFVIERQRLGQVLAELKFSMSDLVDPAKAKQLGRMVGVEALVVGTVSDLGNQVELDARLIEVETNRMLLGATATISKDPAVTAMMERGRQEGATGQSALPTVAARPSGSAESLRRLRFDHKLFTFEVLNAEFAEDEVRVLLLYTNKAESSQRLSWMTTGLPPFVVDNVGRRYEYFADSFGGRMVDIPPAVPQQIWFSFRKFQSGAKSVSINVRLGVTEGNTWKSVDVVIRNIPLSK